MQYFGHRTGSRVRIRELSLFKHLPTVFQKKSNSHKIEQNNVGHRISTARRERGGGALLPSN